MPINDSTDIKIGNKRIMITISIVIKYLKKYD